MPSNPRHAAQEAGNWLGNPPDMKDEWSNSDFQEFCGRGSNRACSFKLEIQLQLWTKPTALVLHHQSLSAW
jgi:hypothetical protein